MKPDAPFPPSNPYASPAPLPGGPGSVTPGQVYEYRSAAGLVFWVTLAIIAMMVGDAVLTVTSVVSEVAFPGLFDKEEPTFNEALTVMTMGVCLLVGVLGTIAAYVLSVVMFCMCINRFNKNARALGAKGMEYSPGWAVGWFFIPLANLFMPYKTVSEIYRASDPQANELDWRISPVTATLGWWWGAWIISNIVDNIEARLSFREIAVPAEVSVPLSILAFAMTIVSGVLAIVVVRAILARQETKASRRVSKPPVVPQGFGDVYR